jgi:hypothetical protein
MSLKVVHPVAGLDRLNNASPFAPFQFFGLPVSNLENS